MRGSCSDEARAMKTGAAEVLPKSRVREKP